MSKPANRRAVALRMLAFAIPLLVSGASAAEEFATSIEPLHDGVFVRTLAGQRFSSVPS